MTKLPQLVITIVAASALLLASCGQTGAPPAPPAAVPEGTKPAPEQKDDKLSLFWMIAIPESGPSLPGAGKDFIKKTIEDKFKVDLRLEYLPMGDMYTSKLNALLAGDNPPDMFQADGAKSYGYIREGAAADLTPYVTPLAMPNYFKWVTPDEVKRYQAGQTFRRAPVPFSKNYYGAYYVRKDWIDALNNKNPSLQLKVPTNYDEMIAVMKAFTFEDPDGNGKNDTYGYTSTGSGMAIPNDMPQWFKYGLTPGFYIDEGGRLIDSGTNKRTALVLDDIRAMMEMKIIDPDWFKNKAGENMSRVQQGKAGIFFSNVRDIAFDHSPNSVQKKTREMTGNENATFEAFHIAGSTPVTYAPIPGIPFMLGAKTTEAKARRTVEILDYLASPEGWLLTHIGKENVHYKRYGSKITLIPDVIQKEIGANGNFTEIWGSVFGYKVKDPAAIGLTIFDPRETEHDRSILRLFQTLKLYELGTNVAPPPGVDIGTYRKEMRALQAKTLFEDKDSANWPAYLDELLGKHKGRAIFDTYAQQITNALGRKVTFSAD